MFCINIDSVYSPLEQFTILPITTTVFGFSNLEFYLVILVILLGPIYALSKGSVISPKRWRLLIESLFEFQLKLCLDTVGPRAVVVFPLLFSLFLSLALFNYIGLIPYTYTVTAQGVVTFGISLIVFVTLTISRAVRYKTGFLSLFLPQQVPLAIAPLFIIIEYFSYLIRGISLGLRLFANMVSGHALMKIFGALIFTFVISEAVSVHGLFFIILIKMSIFIGLFMLEALIAVLQAYVFTILTLVYVKDVYAVSH